MSNTKRNVKEQPVSSDSEEDESSSSEEEQPTLKSRKALPNKQPVIAKPVKVVKPAAKSQTPPKNSVKEKTAAKPAAKMANKAKEVTSKQPLNGGNNIPKTPLAPSKKSSPDSMFSTGTDSKITLTAAETKEKTDLIQGYIGELVQGPVKVTLQKGTPSNFSAAHQKMNGSTYAPVNIRKYTLKERPADFGKDTMDNKSALSKNSSPTISDGDLFLSCWTEEIQKSIESLDTSLSRPLSSSSRATILQNCGSPTKLLIYCAELMISLDSNGKTAHSTASAPTVASISATANHTTTQSLGSLTAAFLAGEGKTTSTMTNITKEYEILQNSVQKLEDYKIKMEKQTNPLLKKALQDQCLRMEKEVIRLAANMESNTHSSSYIPTDNDADPNDEDCVGELEVTTDEEEE